MGTAWGGARLTIIGLGKDAAKYENLQTETFSIHAGMEVARNWQSEAIVPLRGSAQPLQALLTHRAKPGTADAPPGQGGQGQVYRP